ncbi:MAG: 50S ribosomal protein L18 [Campylobacterales bacterium]
MTKEQMRKNSLRLKRKRRIRGVISGCEQRPRVSVFRSNRYFYAQAIDDTRGVTLCAVDGCKEKMRANKEDVVKLAAIFAERLKSKGITKIVYDRNGYLYHGVVAAFADGLRSNGIEF